MSQGAFPFCRCIELYPDLASDPTFFSVDFTAKENSFNFPFLLTLMVFIGKVRADVSKRGVDDGNQKGGGSLQPAKKNQYYYIIKNINVKKKV